MSFTLVRSHTFWKEIPVNYGKLNLSVSEIKGIHRDVCGAISTWHSLAHWGNRQETHGVAAWWKVGDWSIFTGLVEWILYWPASNWRFFGGKKHTACCLLKTKYLAVWWKEVLKLNIVIWRENLCASENANCHQPPFFRRQPVESSSPKKNRQMQVSIKSTRPIQ